MVNIKIFVSYDKLNRYHIGWDEDMFPLDDFLIRFLCHVDGIELKNIYNEYNAKSYCDMGDDIIYFEDQLQANKFLEWMESKILLRILNGEVL